MNGFFSSFISLFSWTTSDLVIKHALERAPLWRVSFWTQLFGGSGILLIGILLGYVTKIDPESLSWIFLLSFMNAFGMFFFYRSIQHKGVALSLPIIYSWPLVSIFIGMIFLHEFPSIIQWFAITLVLSGIFAVSLDKKKTRWVDFGTIAALISMLIWGIFYVVLREPSELYGEWWISGSLKLGTALFSLPFLIKENRFLPSSTSTSLWITLLAIGLLDANGLIFLSMGLQKLPVALVTSIISTTPAIVALCGVLFFKERVNFRQGIGIFSTILGLILLIVW